MYKFVFYHYYTFFEIIRSPTLGLKKGESGAIVLLSIVQYFNVHALKLFFILPINTIMDKYDLVFMFALLGVNWLIFLKDKKYIEYINKCRNSNETKWFLTLILTIIYTVGSIWGYHFLKSSGYTFIQILEKYSN